MHSAQGISAIICMNIAVRKHCDKSPSHPQWKANFDQGAREKYPCLLVLQGHEATWVQHLRLDSVLAEQIDEVKMLLESALGGPSFLSL